MNHTSTAPAKHSIPGFIHNTRGENPGHIERAQKKRPKPKPKKARDIRNGNPGMSRVDTRFNSSTPSTPAPSPGVATPLGGFTHGTRLEKGARHPKRQSRDEPGRHPVYFVHPVNTRSFPGCVDAPRGLIQVARARARAAPMGLRNSNAGGRQNTHKKTPSKTQIPSEMEALRNSSLRKDYNIRRLQRLAKTTDLKEKG